MGNCQAVDAAAMVIQHPNGKIERLYWPIPVSEVMKNNPGHYVSLIIPLQVSGDESSEEQQQGVPPEKKTVRYTRVKLLRPTDTLVLGHAYRLLTSQEVMKVLRAKKHAKMKKSEQESAERLRLNSEKRNSGDDQAVVNGKSETNMTSQVAKDERQRARAAGSNAAAVGKSKSWRPALQSISEAGS